MIRRTFSAKLVRVVDGDTVELTCDTGFYSTHTVKFRLAGIDTPELKQAGGSDARQAIAGLLASVWRWTWFTIHSEGVDKYGRWLVTIPLYESAGEADTINQRLVEMGIRGAVCRGCAMMVALRSTWNEPVNSA